MAVLRTNTANCRDCYACVRACPVKAIRVNTGHAEIVPELCILDGSCVAACPQGAKQVEEHTSRVLDLLSQGKTAFTLAPSVAAAFPVPPGVVAAALRRLGAVAVGETAETSGWVSRRHWEQAVEKQAVLSSCCPAVVNLISTYYPGVLPYLASVVSPMVAHGRALKAALGEHTYVVFTGPCIAKKGEMSDAGLNGSIDAVLTFDELRALLDQRVPGWDELAPEPLDVVVDRAEASVSLRRFPLPGGMMALLGDAAEQAKPTTMVVTGIKRCMELLADVVVNGMPATVVEMMACEDGCTGGPAMCGREPAFRRQLRLESYAANPQGVSTAKPLAAFRYGDIPLERGFNDHRPHLPQPSEEEVRAILASIGKRQAADELNCGACGYDSCRAKAIAVFRGMAEREMCIPYMRRKAESMAEVTIAATPTGVLVINRSLHVLSLNPAAERMFRCHAGDYVGRPLWRLYDPSRVERLFATHEPFTGVVRHEKQGLIVRESMVYDPKNDLVIVLITDITEEMRRREEFAALRETTLERAQEVIDQQMRVAQEIAGLLGETTAETKAILTRLMRLFSESEEQGHGCA